MPEPTNPSRREALKLGVFAGAGLAFGGWPSLPFADAAEQQQLALITKPIPSSGQRIPVVGVGTNAYGVTTPEQKAPLRDVLKRLPELGGSVVDTAHGYGGGNSERVIGELVKELANRDRIFLVTKVSTGGDLAAGKAQMEESFRRLQTDKVDGLLVHNLGGVDVLMPVFQEWKQAGKVRYVGISTSSDGQYAPLMEFMRKYPLDIIQVDYSLGNRGAVDVGLLALAQERGTAVMVNVPFGGRRGASTNFARLATVPVPGWAQEADIKSWPQYFLKYVVSHPAVTVAIPGTRSLAHLEDNQGAARGRLPDAATRKRMEEFWDTLPG
jgi:aryl-alcohol dehydrogenase-like predicted oxidoreductase